MLGDGGPGAAAELDLPTGLAYDPGRGLLIADKENHRVRLLRADGTIETVAAGIDWNLPAGLAVDGDGSVYVSEQGGHRIRVIRPAGETAVVAGRGVRGASGDGGPALSAQLSFPTGLAVDPAGTLWIADRDNHRVRRIDAGGVIETVAGTGLPGCSGDGGPASGAALNFPFWVAVAASGIVFVADTGNHRVRRIDPDGVIETVAGTGLPGFSGDGGPATAARLACPTGLAPDASGALYVADRLNHRIRVVDRDGAIATVAGTGEPAFAGDGGLAAAARLNCPFAIALDGTGDALYVSDRHNHVVRKVSGLGARSRRS